MMVSFSVIGNFVVLCYKMSMYIWVGDLQDLLSLKQVILSKDDDVVGFGSNLACYYSSGAYRF